MATMPTIDFGDRAIAIPGDFRTPNLDTGAARYAAEGGRARQRAVGAVADALWRVAEIKDRADARDATYAMHQAQTWFEGKWHGTDEVGADGRATHVPGVADRTWREMEADGTDPARECARLKREFRETDVYKKLSGGARAHFDRQFRLYEGRLDNAAAKQGMALAARKIDDLAKEDAVFTAKNVSKDMGADDATFENSAAWGATQTTRLALGSMLENGEEIAADGSLRLKDMVFRGGRRLDQLDEREQRRVLTIYDESLKNFRLNRVKALADAAAGGRGLGGFSPEQCIDKAREMTFVMNGAGLGFDPKTGEKVRAKDGTPLPAQIGDEKRNDCLGYIDGAAKKLEGVRDLARKKDYGERLNFVGELALSLNVRDEAQIMKVGNDLDYDAFCADLKANHPGLAPEQSLRLREDYQRLCNFFGKYKDDKKKFEEEQTRKANERKAKEDAATEARHSQYGWVRPDGVFVPASAFPKQSERAAQDEFAETNAIWQNPQTAMARLEAARMTGRLDEADYRRAYAYGTMRMSDDAARWWDANVGKIKELQVAQYGVEKPDGAARKHRKEHANDVKAAGGLYATKRGVAKSFGYSADFVADALAADEDGGEELVPPETLEKVYDTVRRLAANGVDPADACRAILQPAIKAGVDRDLRERLTDPDYFNKVVEDYRRFGTRFTETANANAAAGRGTNWYADVNQTTGKTLVKRGDLTLKPAGKTADEKKTDAK